MSFLSLGVDEALRRAALRWRRLHFLEHTAILALATMAALFVVGVAAWRDVLRNTIVASLLVALTLTVSGITFLVLLVVATLAERPRSWLARQLERVHRPLFDRLNTLTLLQPRHPSQEAYFRRIEEQASDHVGDVDFAAALPSRKARWLWSATLGAAVALGVFAHTTHPWTHLSFEPPGEGVSPSEPNDPLPPPEDAAEVQGSWGEVRIVEPGRDMRVTKVDVVPLEIQAATSDELSAASWFTAAGGKAKQPHALPAPGEPHFAVYKPLLNVDELRLSDWDVLTYYADASTKGGRSYASEVYFLEIRPFREEILKLPGGGGGRAYAMLNEISGLIDRQKHVIRETHGYLQRAYATPATKAQDRDKLANAEGDLAEATRHLYARIATEMEHQNVGTFLDQLAQAEGVLRKATTALRADDPAAPALEQEALAALVATRKALQKAITENPGAFGGSDATDDEVEPTAELPGKLKEIAEFRDEEKATRAALDELVQKQRDVVKKAETADADTAKSLAREEDALRKELSDLETRHPRVAKGAAKEAQEADAALEKAARALQGSEDRAAGLREARGAEASLERLLRRVAQKAEEQRLGQAYALKKMVDEQAKGLADVERRPERADEAARLANEAKATTRELQKAMADPATGGAFGPPIREALDPERQAERERRLDAVGAARSDEARQTAAKQARKGLEELSQAFEKSEPSVSRAARSQDNLGPSDAEALERALAQIEALAAEAETGHKSKGEDDEKRRREALLNLRQGTEGLYGKNERTARLLVEVEEELRKAEGKVAAARLRKLLDQIEQFRVEMSDKRLAQDRPPDLTHIDLSRVPPAYRDRIERYFRKLSEERRSP